MAAGWSGLGVLDAAERGRSARARESLGQLGWMAPAWPEEYGGAGLTPAETVVLVDERTAAGIPFGNDNDVFGIGMLGNTVLRWAKPELLRRFLPRTVSATAPVVSGPASGARTTLANRRRRRRVVQIRRP